MIEILATVFLVAILVGWLGVFLADLIDRLK